GKLDLELRGQDIFDVDRLFAAGGRAELELRRGDHRVGDQKIVLGLEYLGFLALLESDRERLAQLGHAFFGQLAEGDAGPVVDQLDHADQVAASGFRHGRHQHLLGSIAGALVDFLEETQVGVVSLQLALVVHVLQVEHLLRQGDEARDRVLGDRQLQILERVQAGLDLGDDALPVLAHGVDREPVGVEQGADVGADLEHDLVHVGRGVDLVGDRLQILLEIEPAVDISGRAQVRLKYRAHWQFTLVFSTLKYPVNQLLYHRSTPRGRALFTLSSL